MNNRDDKLIVGIDPGTTSALAVLDLRSNQKKVESGKNFSEDRIINSIIQGGTPVLISTDKAKVPSLVEDISSNFKGITFSPDEDLSVQRKKDIVEGYDYENLHERDALAAALCAFHSYENKFRNIEKRTDELNIQNLAPQIKELVVTEKVKNVSQAIEKVLKGESDERDTKRDSTGEKFSKSDLKEKIENYRKNLLEERKDKEKLMKHNESLKERIEELENKKEGLIDEIDDIESGKRDKMMEKDEIKRLKRNIRSKENEIGKLRDEVKEKSEQLSTLKTFETLRKGGKIPLREFDSVTEEDLRKFNRSLSLENSAILVEVGGREDEKTPNLLEELGVGIVVGDFGEEFEDEMISRGIWTIPSKEVDIEERKGVKYVDREVVEKLKKSDRSSFLDWLKRYRDRDD